MNTTVSRRTPHRATESPRWLPEADLLQRYQRILSNEALGWTTHQRKLRLLGTGGQGTVFLSERQGTDRFRLPVALKVFSPENYSGRASYEEDMGRIADIAGRVALIQHDNLLDVHNFIEQDGIRIMEMEWVDGFDLRSLLTQRMLDLTRERLPAARWDWVNNVIITAGPAQPRLKPGVAIQVLRECLAGLAALHREGIVHGDLKPSNIMIKRTGNAKVIDIGSAMDLRNPSGRRMWSPAYAAPEVLDGHENSARSDLASLGYILVEMLAGQAPFEGLTTIRELVDAKKTFDRRMPAMLPAEVSCNDLLLNLCQRLVAPDPDQRFPSAQAADLGRKGAADFHRQLVKGDLASEYENDIRVWLGKVGEMPASC
jgi:serine/threonine-protein kinase